MSLARLLTLPTEIRAHIFEHVLTDTDQTLVTFRLDAFQREYYTYATQPALTCVSRQIRCESLPIWYESNCFILHTEDSKARDVQRWLECNEKYLERIRHIKVWIRYLNRTITRASSQGAIAISCHRRKKHDPWHVNSEWTWITVLKRPPGLRRDAEFLVRKLKDIISAVSKDCAGVDDYYSLMSDLRLCYEEMSQQ